MRIIISKFFQKIGFLLREHWLAITLALALTLVIFYPLISFPFIVKDSYQGINIAHFGSDEHFYLVRAKEILEGHGLGNPILSEGKEGQDPFFMLNERVLLTPLRVLGIYPAVSVVTIYNIYNFLGVFSLILIIYSFGLQLKNDRKYALATSLMIIGGYSLIYNKAFFFSDFNIYGRAMFPYISSIVFFSYLTVLTKALKSGSNKLTVIAGLIFGAIFYVYFFAWSFVLALNGCLLGLYLLLRDYKKSKQLALVMVIGLALGTYNVYKLFTYMTTEAGKQLAYFQWSSVSHEPVMSLIGLATGTLFIFYVYWQRRDTNNVLLLGLIIAGWIALNQQIITGRTVQYAHYYWYFVVPLSVVTGFYMLWPLLKTNRQRWLVFGVVVVAVFVNSVVGQYRSSLTTLDFKHHDQKYRPILDRLNQEKTTGTVLTAEDAGAYETLVNIYTDHDLFWRSFAGTYNTPFNRFKDTLYLYTYLNPETRQDFSGYIKKMMAEPGASAYRSLYENIEGYWSGLDFYRYQYHAVRNDEWIKAEREKTLAILTPEYQKVATDQQMAVLLRSYGVSYIIWDKNLNPEWDLSFIKGLEEIASNQNIYLYQWHDAVK